MKVPIAITSSSSIAPQAFQSDQHRRGASAVSLSRWPWRASLWMCLALSGSRCDPAGLMGMVWSTTFLGAIPAWRGLPHRGFLLVFGQRVPLGRFPQDQHQRHVCSGPGRRRSAFPVAPPTFPERHTGEREPGRCPTRRLAHADPLFVWHMAVKIRRRLGH